MNRRSVLGALTAGGAIVAGCLDIDRSTSSGGSDDESPAGNDDEGTDGGSSGGNDEGTDDSPAVPDPSGDCGIAADALSSRLVEDGGNADQCLEDMTPSFELANEREEAVSATVTIESDGEPVFEGSYDLDAGGRVLENETATAAELDEGRVTVDVESDEFTGSWDEFSCRRHAVALTADGIDVGYVEPMAGPADTQHDCYAGDSIGIRIYNGENPQTGTVSIVDHCEESTAESDLDLDADETTRIEDALVSGGVYDVVVDIDEGGSDRYEFHEECWGLTLSISEEGTATIEKVGID